jgi:hypothetical protein
MAFPIRRGLISAIALFAVLRGITLSAHPTATSFVVIHVAPAGSVAVSVTTDARPLLMKLEALAGVTPSPAALPASAVDARIQTLSATIVQQLELDLDGTPADLTVQGIERLKDRPEAVQILFTTRTPSSAETTLRWRTSLFFGSYPLAVRAGDVASAAPDAEQYEWLSGAEVSQPYRLGTLAAPESGWRQAGRFVLIGFTHILPGGLDHVLFVLGLFLLASNARALLLQVSAFTVAHSCTLGLAMAGWVRLPGAIVEPLIAASIAYIAIENLVTTRLSTWRLGVVFLFGLLHGLGFAGALASLGLSDGHFAGTLVGFNVGVELGQLAVVLGAALVVYALRLNPDRYRRLLVRPASAAIAAMGIFWAIERIL